MQPKGFWSYARGDDDHLDGVLTSLRKRLEGEISMLLGQDVGIFQDIHEMRTGDKWAEKLKDEVTQAAFLIPVLTPRYFNRDWCREETLTFLKVAEEKGVTPLIFPIRFVEFDEDEACEVRAALEPFQYKDFSQWRLESDPTKKARLENEYARDVKAQLKLPQAVKREAPSQAPKSASATGMAEESHPSTPAARVVTQELVVDPWPGRGDFTSIKPAMEVAKPGARIVIRPGTYAENLVLDKPLELIGEGARDEVVVAVNSGKAMQVIASLGIVRNIRFLRGDGEGNNVAVWVTAGRCAFEDCSFSSRRVAGMEVKGLGTAPSFLRCLFSKSKESGAYVWEQAKPKFEECRFSENGFNGFAIKENAHAELRRCVLERNVYSGAHCYEGGRGQFSGCEFSDNGMSGVVSKENAAPWLTHCHFIDNRQYGFAAVDTDGAGTIEDCLFRGNSLGAWYFADGSEGNVVRRNNTEE